MPDKLKDYFDERMVRAIAGELRAASKQFDEAAFVRDCLRGLSALELTARGRHVSEVMKRHLPAPFAKAARVLLRSLGPRHESTESFGFAPFRYLPHVFFVRNYGLDDFELSMQLQYELTKRFTAEFSIRAFLVAHPEATLARLERWSRDDDVHVRRLVSEGTRPRLPWASRLPAFQADPSPVLELLERLKDDPERYVQRSVANNLNDIGKDHPDVAAEVCRRWSKGAPPGRRWIVQHALRSLVKSGHAGALATLGVGKRPEVAIRAVRLEPKSVRVGGELRFSFELSSTAKRKQDLLVDYAVHFVKSSGVSRPKVFKLRRLSLAPNGRAALGGKVSFRVMTTRKPNPGRHRIEVLVNGVAHRLAEFDVRR